MDGIQFFLTRYGRTRDFAREMLSDVSEKQIRAAPCEGVNTLAWLAWHLARVEDVGVNRLVLDDRQIIERNGWASRLNVTRRDFGTGMTPAEVCELSMSIDLEQLAAYRDAVEEHTLDVVHRIHPDDLDTINEAAYVQRVVDEDAFVSEDAGWVPE